MDMRVDTDALVEGATTISNSIDEIEFLISFIEKKLQLAGEDFTSVNYTRTTENVASTTTALRNMNAKLEMVKKYLKRLMDCVEAYNKIRF